MHRTLTTGSTLIAALMAAHRLAGQSTAQHAGPDAATLPDGKKRPETCSTRPGTGRFGSMIEEAAPQAAQTVT
jgi:hypothetical protein